jgi:hypothetical protein
MKSKRAPKPEPVQSLALPEAELTQADALSVDSFLRNLGPFFRQAGELERASQDALAASRLVQPPATPEADEAIQTTIKAHTAGRKAVEAHWGITTLFSQFHKRLTAARGRATGNYEDASNRLQRLHNDFVEAARRKAAAEQERIRQENERKAQADRDAELARLEEEAVKAEAASADLSEREEIFVDLVASGVTASQAAHRAGYKDTTRGLKMLEMPKIQAAITAKQDAKRIRDQKAAVAEQPLTVRHEEVKADVRRAAGAADRTYHHADILDAEAFVKAALAGTYGIPAAALLPNQVWLNDQAKSLQQQIERWPGIAYRKTTKTV